MNRIPFRKQDRAVTVRATHGRTCPVCGRPVLSVGRFGSETAYLHKLELTVIGGIVTYREMTDACLVKFNKSAA